MTRAPALAVLVVVAACSGLDVKTATYANMAEAQPAIAEGLMPPGLPRSSFEMRAAYVPGGSRRWGFSIFLRRAPMNCARCCSRKSYPRQGSDWISHRASSGGPHTPQGTRRRAHQGHRRQGLSLENRGSRVRRELGAGSRVYYSRRQRVVRGTRSREKGEGRRQGGRRRQKVKGRREVINGAEDWNRTSDTSIFSAVLYRLSYLGTVIRLSARPSS